VFWVGGCSGQPDQGPSQEGETINRATKGESEDTRYEDV
jgi:hypothetical protein